MAKPGTTKLGRSFPGMTLAPSFRMKDVDAIRPPSPRLTRAAVIALALLAGGSFTSSFLRQVVGPLTLQPPAEEAPAAAPLAQPLPIAPVIQPALQVATVEPAPARPPKLEVPDPVTPPAAEAAPPQEAVVAPPVDAATTAPAEPPAAEEPPPEEPPR
jgi:hypothetical protein